MDKFQEKSKGYNTYLAIIISSFTAASGFYGSVLNIMSTDLLENVYHLSGDSLSNAHGNLFLFQIIGTLVSSYVSFKGLVNSWPRTKMLLLAAFLSVLSYPVSLFPNLYMLYLSRFISGFGSGLDFITMIWMQEVLPPRGLIFGFLFRMVMESAFSLGGVSISFIFDKQERIDNWRYIFLVTLPIDFIRLVALSFIKVDTPKYYLRTLPRPEAEEKVQEVVDMLYTEEDSEAAQKLILHNYDVMTRWAKKKKVSGVKLLFTPEFKNRMILGLIIAFMLNVSGSSIFGNYSTDLFDLYGKVDGAKLTAITSIVSTAAGFLSLYTTGAFNRRTLILWGLALQSLALIGFNFGFYNLDVNMSVAIICVFKIVSNLGFGGVGFIYISDILPGSGVGICLLGSLVFSSAVNKLVPMFLNKDDMTLMVSVFALLTVLGFLYLGQTLYETKGKSKDEILNHFLPGKLRELRTEEASLNIQSMNKGEDDSLLNEEEVGETPLN